MANKFLFENNLSLTLASDYGSADPVMSVTTAAALPTIDPGEQLALTLENPDTGDLEIVYVTAVTGNDLTVSRAQEGTVTPASFPAATTVVEGRVTEGMLAQFYQKTDDSTQDGEFLQSNGGLLSGALPTEVNVGTPGENHEGKFWYEPTDGKLQVYNGSWEFPGTYLRTSVNPPAQADDYFVYYDTGFKTAFIKDTAGSFFNWRPLAGAQLGTSTPLAFDGLNFFNTDTYQLQVADENGQWQATNPNYYQASAPTNPFPGQIWVDNTKQQLYIYGPGLTAQPVQINAYQAAAPTNPFDGMLWLNSGTAELSMWDGSTWRAAAGGGPGGSSELTIVNYSGTGRDLASGDENKYLRCTNGATCTMTVKEDGTGGHTFLEGTYMYFKAVGNEVVIAKDPAVVINTPESTLTTERQNALIMLVKVGVNEWDASGQMVLD